MWTHKIEKTTNIDAIWIHRLTNISYMFIYVTMKHII